MGLREVIKSRRSNRDRDGAKRKRTRRELARGVCACVHLCICAWNLEMPRGHESMGKDTLLWTASPCGRNRGGTAPYKHLDCKSAAHVGENGWICMSPSWAPSKEGPGQQGGQGTPRWRSCDLQSKAEPGAGVGAEVRLPAHLQARPSGLPSIRAAPAVVLRGTQWWLPSGLCPGSGAQGHGDSEWVPIARVCECAGPWAGAWDSCPGGGLSRTRGGGQALSLRPLSLCPAGPLLPRLPALGPERAQRRQEEALGPHLPENQLLRPQLLRARAQLDLQN